MVTLDYEQNSCTKPCARYKCKKDNKCCGLSFYSVPSSLTTEMTPRNGLFCNTLVKYEETGEIYLFSSEGIPTLISGGDVQDLLARITALETTVSGLQSAVSTLQNTVGAMGNSISILQGNVTTAQGDITSLQGTTTTLQGNVTTLQGNVTTLQGNVTTLQTTVAGKQNTLTAGDNITIVNDVISSTGGGEEQTPMLVNFSEVYVPEAEQNVWTWTSEYTYEQLSADPEAVQVFVNGNPCSRLIKPDLAGAGQGEIHLLQDIQGVSYEVVIRQPQEYEGETWQLGELTIDKYTDEHSTKLTVLPTLELADYATSIPEGTTVVLYVGSTEKGLYSRTGGVSDCTYLYPYVDVGNFMVLPVKRKVDSGVSGWVTERCLLTSTTERGSSSVSDGYVYKTFMFNGENYKMVYTSQSGSDITYTIHKWSS